MSSNLEGQNPSTSSPSPRLCPLPSSTTTPQLRSGIQTKAYFFLYRQFWNLRVLSLWIFNLDNHSRYLKERTRSPSMTIFDPLLAVSRFFSIMAHILKLHIYICNCFNAFSTILCFRSSFRCKVPGHLQRDETLGRDVWRTHPGEWHSLSKNS